MVEETRGWIEEKQLIANDASSYLEPTNLRGKYQRHQAFEAELVANARVMDFVNANGTGSFFFII